MSSLQKYVNEILMRLLILLLLDFYLLFSEEVLTSTCKNTFQWFYFILYLRFNFASEHRSVVQKSIRIYTYGH